MSRVSNYPVALWARSGVWHYPAPAGLESAVTVFDEGVTAPIYYRDRRNSALYIIATSAPNDRPQKARRAKSNKPAWMCAHASTSFHRIQYVQIKDWVIYAITKQSDIRKQKKKENCYSRKCLLLVILVAMAGKGIRIPAKYLASKADIF